MKVLIANKFWYRRGGDCIYAINLERMLRKNGIQTAVFAMRHPENIGTAFDDYFPSEISFSASQNIGGTPAPPPISRGLSPETDVSYPFPSPVRTSRTVPAGRVLICSVPLPTVL